MEDVQCYFNFRPVDNQRRRSPATQMDDLLHRPYCSHSLILWTGAILIFMLIGAVLTLGILVLQSRDALNAMRQSCNFSNLSNFSPETEPGTFMDNYHSLRQYLCQRNDSHTAENSHCKVCPEKWLPYEDKCFWVSKIKQTWNYSKKDCAEKDAQLAVVHEQEDLEVISSVTEGAKLLWIGLKVTSSAGNWTWVDGSPLNHTLLQVKGESQANSCGMLNGAKVISDSCNAVTKWICQKDALHV